MARERGGSGAEVSVNSFIPAQDQQMLPHVVREW